MITSSMFATVRDFILERGDRQTYCNMYNHNPHYDFGEFSAFLNPEGGQRNINCDPTLSGFDEIVLRAWNAHVIYVHVRLRGPAIETDASDETLDGYWSRMMEVVRR